ncbi:ribosomal protein S18-alanine N-acetyltransferase [Arenicella xantha]|nr:ribosomal protein S18-alanine N-acetyltransferase [Arenicella xantha]
MRTEDLTAVLLIEQNAQISPWSRLSFEASLSNGDWCRVLCVDNRVVGYHVCSTVLDELHLLNVVVAPSMQGKGFGHRLMHDIAELAATNGLVKIFLEVRVSNVVAQTMYQQWQFKQIGIRKQYYAASNADAPTREDALVFMRLLGDQ